MEGLAVHVDLSQQHRIVQYREDSPAGAMKQLLKLGVLLGGRHAFEDNLAGAEKPVERCTELVRYQSEELVLRSIQNCEPLIGQGKLACARGYRALQALVLQLHFPLKLVQFEMSLDAGVNFFELERLGDIVHPTGPEKP